MSDEEQQSFEDYMMGTTVRPPRGSVFDDYDSSGGPPMMRMIMLQFAFQWISSFRSVSKKGRAVLIGLVCAYLCWSDIQGFLKQRNPNLYSLIGAERSSETAFINERLDLASNCYREATEEACQMFNFKKGEMLNKTEIEQIRYVLVNKPYLKKLYDKSEIFIRKSLEKTYHNPTQGKRYLSALGDLTTYSMYVVYLTLSVESY